MKADGLLLACYFTLLCVGEKQGSGEDIQGGLKRTDGNSVMVSVHLTGRGIKADKLRKKVQCNGRVYNSKSDTDDE